MPSVFVIALTAAVLAHGCTCARPAKESAERTVAQSVDPAIPAQTRGMWAWRTKARLDDPSGPAALAETCRRANLNELYLSVNEAILGDPRLPSLMGALESAGVRVEALMGEAEWYQHDRRAPMLALIDSVAAYGEKHTAARFRGIHLDIEPHQLPANKGNHGFLPALAETLGEAARAASKRSLTASADLPRFALDDEGPAFARSGVRIFVMLYELRDRSSERLVSTSGSVLGHTYAGVGGEVQSGAVIGLSVDDYPTDLEVMLAALDRSRPGGARYAGWAIHDEAKYRHRAGSRPSTP